MPSSAPMHKTERLNVRVSREQSELIRLAAREMHEDLSAFLVESACMRAEEALASQRHIVYSAKQWDSFTAALDRPAKRKPQLAELMGTPSVLERK